MKQISILCICLVIVGIVPYTLYAQNTGTFLRDLMYGDRGADVLELQKILNKDGRTLVATEGPGSIGFETTYFGQKTENAVKRFQELHRANVLTPLGLSQGTGYVGEQTRLQLVELHTKTDDTQKQIQTPKNNQSIFLNPPKEKNNEDTLSQESYNPNQEHVEEAVAMIRSVAREQGYDEASILQFEQGIRDIAATTTDLTQLFIEKATRAQTQEKSFETLRREAEEKAQEVQSNPFSASSKTDESHLAQIFSPLVSPFSSLAIKYNARQDSFEKPPENNLAQLGLFNFGGNLLFTFPCLCNPAVWKVFIGPPKPFVGDYILGTQLFLTYTFPSVPGAEALGLFIPGPPVCPFFPITCAPFPGIGLVTPIVGSALLPSL